jgi:GT2 family glycosyltransferase
MAAPDEATRADGLTTIVIVAADSGALLRESVARVLESTAAVEVVVVDNASSDGEPARLASNYSGDARLRIERNVYNAGFGTACNQGAALARGDALVFLNPDCLLDPGAVSALRALAASDARIGVLGVDVLSPDGTPARGNRRRDPLLRRAMMTFSGLSRLAGRWPALAGVEIGPDDVAAQGLEPVDAVSGACLFLPRPVFESVGGFDEGYFLHVEDLDLCRRVRDAGYIVAIAHEVRATHAQGSSSRHRPVFVGWHKHRGMWRYFTRFDPAARNPLLRVLVRIGLWTHFVLMVPVYLLRRVRASQG